MRIAAYRGRSAPAAIQEHLGHDDITTTFKVYGHLLPSMHEALAAALDVAYEGGGEAGRPTSGFARKKEALS